MQAMAARGLPGAWGEPGSAFGTPDTDRCDLLGWEPICEESSADVTYWAWRRPLRQGLYLYRTHAVIENASAAQLRRFQHDDVARCASPRDPTHRSSCSLEAVSSGEGRCGSDVSLLVCLPCQKALPQCCTVNGSQWLQADVGRCTAGSKPLAACRQRGLLRVWHILLQVRLLTTETLISECRLGAQAMGGGVAFASSMQVAFPGPRYSSPALCFILREMYDFPNPPCKFKPRCSASQGALATADGAARLRVCAACLAARA